MYSLIKPILFQLDPELTHEITLKFLQFVFQPFLAKWLRKKIPQHPMRVFGLSFPNPIGLAAGFDKNGDCIDALLSLGFGFIEVGTVTPKPQQGNPRPRLFRIPEANAIVNRMGFNNKGVDYLVDRLKRRHIAGIVGVNIGKNALTPIEEAAQDYRICLQKVYPYADYVVINISSPNTPGLRVLQTEQHLDDLLHDLMREKQALEKLHKKQVPLLVKVTIDLTTEQIEYLIQTVLIHQLDGVIASNTSIDHRAVSLFKYGHEKGGLSGQPIFIKSLQMVRTIYRLSMGKLPIIAVGGILSGENAKQMFDAGASLVQIYTGLIYSGPRLIHEIHCALEKI